MEVKDITNRDVDFAKWYTDVCRKADLVDYSSVKGSMIIRPLGYAIWEEIQKNMFKIAEENTKKKTTVAKTLEEFEKNINENQGYVKTMWCGSSECEEKIHELTGAKSRCIPFNQEHISDTCVCCGKPASKMVVWGRQY